MIVAGIDPGFSSLGYVFYDTERRVVLSAGVLRTINKRNKHTLARDDNSRRFSELWEGLLAVWPDDVSKVFVEGMSHPRGAAAAWKLALGWGVVLGIAMMKGVEITQYGPMQIKGFMTGDRTASKEVVIAAVRRALPAMDWPRQVTLHEHQADACGVMLMGLSQNSND